MNQHINTQTLAALKNEENEILENVGLTAVIIRKPLPYEFLRLYRLANHVLDVSGPHLQ